MNESKSSAIGDDEDVSELLETPDSFDVDNDSDNKWKRPIGSKSGKARDYEMAWIKQKTETQMKIAEQRNKKNSLIEEQNAIAILTTQISTIDEDAQEGIKLLRQAHLKRLRSTLHPDLNKRFP